LKYFLQLICCLFLLQINSIIASSNIDYLIVEKSKRTLYVVKNNQVIKEMKISLGFEPLGKKIKKGDGKTPEGIYYIEKKISNSSYYLALKISYPNKWDKLRAKDLNLNPGGQIMIHGLPLYNFDANYHNNKNDWTEGCIAVSNSQIKYLWNNTPLFTPILIKK